MALPSNMAFGKIVGRFMRAIGDGSDADRDPDGIPLAGLKIVLTPSADVVRIKDAAPDPVTVFAESIACTTDSEGYVVQADENGDPTNLRGVYVPATDTEWAQAVNLRWTVTIQAGGAAGTQRFSFLVPADSETDLTTVVPVPSNPGSQIPAWEAVVAQANAAANRAEEAVAAGLETVNVTGADELTVRHGWSYEVNGASTPSLSLAGDLGSQVALFWFGDSGSVEGVSVEPGSAWVAVLLSSGWKLYPVAETPSDVTPPTVGTLAASSIQHDRFTLTVSGASDDVALAPSPYRFSTDNGSTWSSWQSGASLVVMGKAASTTYQCKHQVRDAAGNVSTGTAVPVTTLAVDLYPSWSVYDTFSGVADGTPIAGRVTEKGGLSWSRVDMSQGGAYAAGVISDGALLNTTSALSTWDASVVMPTSDMEVLIDYDVASTAEARACVVVAGTSTADVVSVGVQNNGTLITVRGGVTILTLAGVTSGIPTSGEMTVKIEGDQLTVTTSAGVATATVPIDTHWTGTGTRAGVAARAQGARIDNFRAREV